MRILKCVAVVSALSLGSAGCATRNETTAASFSDASAQPAESAGVPKAALYAGAATFGIAAAIFLITAAGGALVLASSGGSS